MENKRRRKAEEWDPGKRARATGRVSLATTREKGVTAMHPKYEGREQTTRAAVNRALQERHRAYDEGVGSAAGIG